jgi:predicted nucleic acid-binding protein
VGEWVEQPEWLGRSLPEIDSLLGAIVLKNFLRLVTCNENDFVGTGVTGVNVVNPKLAP